MFLFAGRWEQEGEGYMCDTVSEASFGWVWLCSNRTPTHTVPHTHTICARPDLMKEGGVDPLHDTLSPPTLLCIHIDVTIEKLECLHQDAIENDDHTIKLDATCKLDDILFS